MTHNSTLLSVAPDVTGDAVISNGRLTLTIAAATGFLSSYADSVSGVSLPLQQEWLWYNGFNGLTKLNGSNQASGAYIFRPAAEGAFPVAPGPAAVTIVTGPVVNETLHEYAYVTQETRLWAGAAAVEIEWTVGPVNVSDFKSHEVITRYSSPGAQSCACLFAGCGAALWQTSFVYCLTVTTPTPTSNFPNSNTGLSTQSTWSTDANCRESQVRA
jgi:hypothetical protein